MESPTKKDLKRAARVARKMGLRVQASKDKHGRISSYYVEGTYEWMALIGISDSDHRPTNPKRYPSERLHMLWDTRIRISDHDIPSTAERQYRAITRGSYFDGSADIYASDSPIRRDEWWKRAITLALLGAEVPGALPRGMV